MSESEPVSTQPDLTPSITAELAAAGFEEAHEIGHGGFGIVYRCGQPSLDRTVAIKVLTSDLDSENLQRFLREQRAMGRLSGHPNIVHILQAGTTPTGRPYIVMEYHPHDSLEARIRRSGPLGWGQSLRLGVKVAGALEAGHRLGTLHRDVKPANILLTDYGEPQLTDFGIARVVGGFETSGAAIAGTPAYLAPEVLKGQAPTPASDVYSLGATIFCAITGHAAFERRSGEQMVAHFLRITTHPVPDLRGEGIPDEVCAAIELAMAGNPDDRPASAVEFGRILQEAERRNSLNVDEMALPTDEEVGIAGPRPRVCGAEIGTNTHPATQLAPPAPSTKFRPPTSTRPLVERRRLIDALRAGARRRLIVIHAPAGFGKSTLALQWRNTLTEEGTPVAWLTVDHDDNNAVWFLVHLIEAIRRVRPGLAHELADTLEEHRDEAERYVLASLINEIHESDERVAVVIDDWHRVTNAATISAMEFLLDNGCHHLQFVVTSRTRSGLPTGRLRVRNELIEIDSGALRFDAREASSFFEDLGGVRLTASDVTDLQESTEGWAAALQLASLSLRRSGDPATLIRHMSGRHHAIGEFLAENVLDALEPEIIDFLLATSITERTCGNLASVLARTKRGQAMLEAVEQRDLFLRRIDDDGNWFRYHRLFAEFLQRRLERDQPERIDELHRTASQWFADHEFLSEAVDHAVAAGDPNRAADLVESQGALLLERSQMATLLALVTKLPLSVAESRPRLQIAVAAANIQLQHAASAKTALERGYALLDRSSLTDAEIATLRIEADVIHGALKIAGDDIDGVDALLAACLSRPDTMRPWIVSGAADIATFVAIYRFDFAAARRLQDWASAYHQQTSGPYFPMYGHSFAGIAANEQLDVVAAEHEFREALRTAREFGGIHSQAARLASALLGELLYEQNKIDEAEHLIDESYELGPEGGVVDFMLARYGTGARIKALRGDLDSARHRLNEGASVARTLSLPRLAARVASERQRWGFSADASFGTSTNSIELRGNGIRAGIVELEETSAIRAMIAAGSLRHADLACDRAQALVNELEDQSRPKATLRAKLLLAACLSAAGRIAQAKGAIVSAVAQCAHLGLIRLLLDGGPEVVTVIEALQGDLRDGKWRSEWPLIPSSFLAEAIDADRNFPQRPRLR
jgi:ATP/maltotriose-dependent transcriptional regulator MalT